MTSTACLLLEPEPLPRRLSAFSSSLLLHSALLTVLAFSSTNTPEPPARLDTHYSVQLIHLDISKYLPPPRSPETRTKLNAQSETTLSARIPMRLPVKHQPVRQTLIRPDVPPDITLQQEIPIPNLLMAFEADLHARPAKPFTMPAVRQPKKVAPAVLPSSPNITGTALGSGELKVLAEMAELPRLPVPQPAMAQSAPGAPPPDAASSENSILSISRDPVLPSEVLAVPPANQIADSGNVGQSAGQSAGNPLAQGRGKEQSGKAESTAGKAAPDSPAALASLAESTGASGPQPALPGTTGITLPKDGKFGVVVMGSAVSAPYPESRGSLSGKVVYTVYLRVGQRKNWILQYCLPRAAAASSRSDGSAAALEAPWPYTIVRPERAGDSEYVLVHGMVTAEGHFDQLAMVYPQNLRTGNDLLFQSLNRWLFRPAKRDGVPAAVEVLLIIPRED